MKLRDDDRPLLEMLASVTGLGRVYGHRAAGTTRPSASWVVCAHAEVGQMARLLDEAGLRGRKGREFDVWRKAALEFEAAHAERRPRNDALIAHASTALIEARKYRPPSFSFGAAPPVERELFLDVLRAVARSTDGPLTSTAYERARARNLDWPERNTIARIFGSWAAALDAAGLGVRCSPRARITRSRGSAPRAEIRARRAQAAACTLDGVWALTRGLGRAPTVHEFLAWRAEHDPSLPSLSSLYRIFPGWASVLDKAGAAGQLESGV